MTRRDAARLVEGLKQAVTLARAEMPGDDYCGRIYTCGSCDHYDGVVAPGDELPDDYACPTCSRPMGPVTEVLRIGQQPVMRR